MKVLLAEDSDLIRRIVTKLLSKQGHRFVVVQNGREAVDRVRRESFDVVLMDLHMPEMDGGSAARRIREWERDRGGRVPIVGMTADWTDQQRRRCREDGMDEFLAKPVDPRALRDVMDRLAGGASCAAIDNTSPLEADDSGDGERHDGAAGEGAAGEGAESRLLDLRTARERIPGGDAVVREMATVLAGECPREIERIRTGLAVDDAAAVRRGAHTLKGSFDVFGAVSGVRAARRLEEIAGDGDLTGAGEALAELADETARLRSALLRLAGGSQEFGSLENS